MSAKWQASFRVIAFALITCAALAGHIAPVEASTLWYSTLQWDGNPQTPRVGTIHSIHDDGTNDATLLNLGGDTTYPKPSPDGQWLYFQSNIGGQYSVYRSRLDGTQVTNLGVLAHQLGLQWQGAATFGVGLSGDGSKITYTIHDGVLGKVVVANADGSNPQFPAPQLDYTYMSGLNYAGNRVAFSGPAQNYRLLSVPLPGTQVQSLTPSHPDSYVPQFAGNGSTIIFVRNDGDIYSVGTGGQAVRRLTNGNNYYEFRWSTADQHGSTDGPSISPDGTKIAYIRKVSGVPQVHTMNVDGSNQQQLTFGNSASGRVVWSPDGQELAFVTFVGTYPQLFVMNAQGETPQQLTNLSGRGVYWVAYQPSLPGDFDSDGDVDGADFVAWQTHFPIASGATLAMGDADRDGDVDGADFVVWQSHFPTMVGESVVAIVEPSSLALFIVGGLAICLRLRRGSSRPGCFASAAKNTPGLLPLFGHAIALLVSLFVTTPTSAQETVWLSSLDLTKMKQGPGPLPTDRPVEHGVEVPAQKVLWLPDKSIREKPLSIAKVKFERGVATHVKSILWLDLAGGSERFMAAVGVDDASQQGPFTLPVNFKIFGDGRKLWESGSMQLGESARPVDVNLKGIKTLLLMATANGYGANFVQANWADARFLVNGPAPRAIDAPSDPAVVLTPKPGPAPRINGPTVYGCCPGSPFIYRIPATGMRPMQFSADDLPVGLKLDSAQGIVAGSIAKRGEYGVTFRAKNGHGNASRPFKIICGDKLALTPTMGWNVWFQSHYHVTDKMMREGADIMVSSGMADVGYQYVMIDDGWSNKETGDDPTRVGPPRDERGNIRPNKNFPDMKALTDYIHQKGLKAGIYSSPGPTTCNGFTASYGHEAEDAKQFADWGFDILKYDWCSYRLISGVGPHQSTDIYLRQLAALQKPYRLMGKLVRQQKRDIVFNLCQYGMGNVWEWGAEVGGQSWRTSLDIAGYELDHVFALALKNAEYRAWSKPGSWNDPDFIQLGYHYNPRGPDLSEPCNFAPTEQYSYMSLWCLSAAPLVYSGDITKLDDFTLNVLCNPEVIEVNQDPLGQCARVILQTGDTFILVKELENGSKAVGLCNGGEWEANMTAKWSDLDLKGRQVVRDLWRQTNCGSFQNEFKAKVPPHGVVLVRIGEAQR